MKNRSETKNKSRLSTFCLKMREVFMKIMQSLFKKKVFEYTDLAPIDNIENGDEYIKALKWALKQQRVKNIAIAGPYGSGKSSIIESFLKLENAKKYLRVSMATFIENAIDSQDPRTDNHISIPTAKIEEGILKQLFYKVNYKRIPQSRYRKLHKIRTFGIGLWMVIAIAIACVLLFVFWPEKFATAVDKVFVAGEKLCLSKNWTIALFGCFSVGCIGLFSYVFRFLLSKIKIKETKIPGVETTIETEGEKNSSVFDKHLDEIVYFFEETKYKVVFFEDLDRLEDPSIFVRLRELNTILNNYDVIKHRIVFVYAVKDDIFTEEDRTKFFDFIIPVIPVINSTNSGEILLHLLEQSKKKGLKHRISQNFIDDVSPYIADMRILLNSYNEFIVYKNTLQTQQGLELSDEMMMAIIIFKNLYPSDFADIQKESGLIKQAFVDKQCFITQKQVEIEQEIKRLSDILEAVEKDILNNIRELKAAMLSCLANWNGVVKQIENWHYPSRTYNAHQIFDESFDLQALCGDTCTIRYISWGSTTENVLSSQKITPIVNAYMDRIRRMRFVEGERKRGLRNKIEKQKRECLDLSANTLVSLIDKYEASSILSSEVQNNSLLVLLLRKNYINEQYANYINYFKGNSITLEDMKFILSIKDHKPLPFSYSLTKIPQILKRLQQHEFDQKSIYNYDLLEHMLSSNDHDVFLERFFTQLSDNTDESWKFIDTFIDKTQHHERFINMLASKWRDMWTKISNDVVLTYERKIKYLRLLISYCDTYLLRLMDKENILRSFIENNSDILQRLNGVDIKKIKKLLSSLEMKFINLATENVEKELLDFVFDNCLYALNIDMIECIVAYKKPELLQHVRHKNYTVITQLEYQPLIDYVHNNQKDYLENIVLSEMNVLEDNEQIIDLLQRNLEELELCCRLVAHEHFCLDKLGDCCKDNTDVYLGEVKAIWNAILIYGRISSTWNNIMEYWGLFQLTSELTEYIAQHKEALIKSDFSCVDEDFVRDFACSDVDIETYTQILDYLRLEEVDIPLENVAEHKVLALIKMRYFDYSAECYQEIADTYPDLLVSYIAANIDQFSKIIQEVQFDSKLFERFILSDELDEITKAHLIEKCGIDNMTAEVAKQMISLPVSMTKELFVEAWKCQNDRDRKQMMIKNLHILEADDLQQCFEELQSEYQELVDRDRIRKVSIHDTPENRLLIKRLSETEYVTSYRENVSKPDENNGMIPANFIECRIKQQK